MNHNIDPKTAKVTVGIDPGESKTAVVALVMDDSGNSDIFSWVLDLKTPKEPAYVAALRASYLLDGCFWTLEGHDSRIGIHSAQSSIHPDVKMPKTEPRTLLGRGYGKVDAIAVEGQNVAYTTKSTQAKPQSICDLSLVTGSLLATVYDKVKETRVFCPKPRDWKGNVPKHINQARTLKSLGIEFTTRGTGKRRYCVPVNWQQYTTAHSSRIGLSNWYDLSDALGLALYANKKLSTVRY